MTFIVVANKSVQNKLLHSPSKKECVFIFFKVLNTQFTHCVGNDLNRNIDLKSHHFGTNVVHG